MIKLELNAEKLIDLLAIVQDEIEHKRSCISLFEHCHKNDCEELIRQWKEGLLELSILARKIRAALDSENKNGPSN